MKVFYILFALFLSIGIVSQAQKSVSIKSVKGSDVKHYEFVSSNTKAPDTDTLSNIGATETLTIYGFGGTNWGTWSGHNYLSVPEYAEHFTNTLSGEVNGALVYVNTAYAGAAGHTVTFNVYADGATPGAILGSKTVDYSAITPGSINDITFDTPVPITGSFYIGYQINYVTPADTFNVVMVLNRPAGPNTAYMKYNSTWTSVATLSGGGLQTSYVVLARCALTPPPVPTMTLTPTSYNAGDIEVATSATSGNFTLKNIGTGTLTISNVTSLTGTPWTTTLVPGSVNLTQNQTATFTFTYSPTVAGTNNLNYIIQTNGGTDTIVLSGMAHNPYGTMLGTFENITDFDLVFPGWTQIDNDGGATYSITGVSFLNQGYTGSFIAFNPALTTPSMSTDAELQPHGGSRFGACFNAVTASAPNDDWLITPQSAVVTAGSTFKAWVKTYTDQYGLERYSIWASTTNTSQASFTKISPNTYEEAPMAWTEITYPLDAYIGQQVYIAIQCVSNDAFIFMVDDIAFNIVNSTNPVSATAAVSVFPNPTSGRLNILNAPNSTVEIYNLVGEKVYSRSNVNTFVDLSSLPNGNYVAKVITNNEVLTQKVNIIR